MSMLQRLRRFKAATKGLAALEFAILLPMMIFLLFGAVELIDVLGANTRAENTTASIADVISRDTEVDDNEIEGIWRATEILMVPDDPTELNIRVTSITIENPTTARVVWSEGHGMAARVADSTVTLPDDMMRPGTSIIMAESAYTYESPIGFVIGAPMTLNHTAYRRSRLIDPIPRET
jgi:Flp pilus assembly protein TadG